ncbi:translation protein [Xylaria nigripes]|nr:translation protein [Xylaria nigripes]
MSSNHGHSHYGEDHNHHDHHDHHGHDHSDDITPAIQRSLYQHIDMDRIHTFNETVRDSGKAIVKKTWNERLEVETELASYADEQLIIHIPFTGQVKLHSILLRTSSSACAPRTLRLFLNRDDLDFSNAEDVKPQQEFELSQTSEVQEIPVKRYLFSNARSLALFFVDNFGEGEEPVTRLSYLAFKGDWMQVGRAPVNILYEAAARPSDHVIKNDSRNQFVEWPWESTMAPQLPARWAPILISSLASRILVTPNHTLLPRIAKRGVKYGWSTAPKRSRPNRFNQVSAGLPAPTTGPAAALKRKESSTPLRTGILATKKGVSAMFDMDGKRTACTILQVDQCQVVANKTRAKNGYWAVQLGCGYKTPDNTTAPLLGYYEAKGIAPKRELAEFKVRSEDGLLPVGVQLQPDWFKVGQFVDARSNSRGMGFAGGMKRHGFAGQGASHGNSRNHRTIGTTGPSQGGGSRVHPGKKMPGRMGNERVTLQNLRVLNVDNSLGIVVVKGLVAGPKGCMVMIADAIKKDPPAETFIEKAKRRMLERSTGHEERLEHARIKHMELKEMRRHLATTRAMTVA